MIDAYRNAGFKDHYANATRLSRNDKVQARIKELMAEAAERYEVTPDKIMRSLAQRGFANMDDYMKRDSAGRPVLDLSRVTRDSAAAIREMECDVVTTPDGMIATRTKIKLADAFQPLKTLAQITGMLATEGPPPQSVVFIVERSGQTRRIEGRTIDHEGR